MVNMKLMACFLLWLLSASVGNSHKMAPTFGASSTLHHWGSKHHHYHPKISIPRGGGAPSSEFYSNASSSSSTTTATPPSIASVGRASVELMKSIVEYTKHVISDRSERIAQEAIKASNYRPPREEQQPGGTMKRNPTTSSNSDVHVKKPSAKMEKKAPPSSSKPFWSFSKKTDVPEPKGIPSLKLLLLPSRMLHIGVTCLVLCELLDQAGILNEETPAILKSQVDRVWHGQLRPTLSSLTQRIRRLWETAMIKRESIELSVKHQFLLGATVGMVTSPLFALVAASSFRPALALYGLAEINAYIKSKYCHWNLGNLFGPIRFVGAGAETILEQLRQQVHGMFQEDDEYAGALITYDPDSLVSYGGGTDQDETTKPYSLAPTPTLAETKRVLEFTLTGQRLPSVGMIRHGFFVGTVIGLMAGV